MSITFFRLLDNTEKAETLLELIKTVNNSGSKISAPRTFFKQINFSGSIPNRPYSYWVPPTVTAAYKNAVDLQSWCKASGVGIQSGDDERFLRLWWEAPSDKLFSLSDDYQSCSEAEIQEVSVRKVLEGHIWVPYFKGGRYSPYYLEPHLVINWKGYGAEIHAFGKGSAPNQQLYFLRGISFLRRTSLRVCATYLPAGCLFGNVSPVIQPYRNKVWVVLAILNSHAGEMLLSPFQTRGSAGDDQTKIYELGFVLQLPVPATVNVNFESEVSSVINSLFEILTTHEISHHFAYIYPVNEQRLIDRLLELEKLVNEAYGWEISDLVSTETLEIYTEFDLEEEIRHGLHVSLLPKSQFNIVSSQFSYALGCILGRWNILAASAVKTTSEKLDPLAPLPVCPPGMLQNRQGLPATPADVPPDYPLRISWPGILVDDRGHPEDAEACIRQALRVIWPDNADAIEQEACQILGVASLRDYFANPNKFFDDHLKRYSKSRRVAPIYWPLSTPSGSYTLWLYYHRLDNQILYTCVNDFVDPKLKDVSEQVNALRQKTNRSKDEEDDLAHLSDLETELQDFRAELLRLAAFWRPNLNDGVQITAAPLWRLFQHRQWQKRLKETWQKLEAGDYDWAHLAMSIWPERVVPKCVEDLSLAIAHDLEDLFWVEDEGSWRLLQEAEQEIAGQIKRWQKGAHNRLGQHLADLAANAGRGMPAYQVWQHLSEGDWDDTPVALALWPERVAEKCWDQPFLAAQLGLKLPNKRTKAHRERFLKKLLADSAPDLADAVAAAFQDESDAFDAVRQALAAGERDEQPLAMALWSERVVDKCAGNLELAAQHHLRRYFWVQPSGGGPWRRRNPQAQEIRDEIARRKGG
jgi:hypothetical protein